MFSAHDGRLEHRPFAPAARPAGAGVVGGRGQRLRAAEVVEHELQVARCRGAGWCRGRRSAPACRRRPIFLAVQRAVAGMICIRPEAPTPRARVHDEARLLADQAVDVRRIEADLARAAPTTSLRNGIGKRCSMSISARVRSLVLMQRSQTSRSQASCAAASSSRSPRPRHACSSTRARLRCAGRSRSAAARGPGPGSRRRRRVSAAVSGAGVRRQRQRLAERPRRRARRRSSAAPRCRQQLAAGGAATPPSCESRASACRPRAFQ